MLVTVELPDDLLTRAKSQSALAGISLRQFLIEAVQRGLAPEKRKIRRDPPMIGDASAPPVIPLTREQIDEATFG